MPEFEIEIPRNPRDWRPQRLPGHRYEPQLINPVIEPYWSGTRVIAHFRDSGTDEWGTVEVLNELGEDASALAPLAIEHLRRSILASEAVIDGVLTEQATVSGEGTAVVVFAQSSPVKRLVIGGPESDIKFEPPKGANRRGEPAFVALDLLSVDGETLFDVPLLERKRVLEGVIEQSELVRVSPMVRPPLRQWFSSWRAAGFRGLMLKATNSRYTPGSETNEWAIVERMPRG
jgi:ATP-dependent DNA ligase